MLQLKRVGVTEAGQMKTFLRDFERYMAENHGVFVEGRKKIIAEGNEASPFIFSFKKKPGG